MIADKCLDQVEKDVPKAGGGSPFVSSVRAKAAKGLVELVRGDLQLGILKPWFLFLGHCKSFLKVLNAYNSLQRRHFCEDVRKTKEVPVRFMLLVTVEDVIVQCIDALVHRWRCSIIWGILACHSGSFLGKRGLPKSYSRGSRKQRF